MPATETLMDPIIGKLWESEHLNALYAATIMYAQ